MEMNRQNLKDFRNDFADAVKELAEKYGVIIQLGNISYDASHFHGKIEVSNTDIDLEKKKFERECYSQGFQSTDYKRKLNLDGTEYKLVGFKPRATKNNCIICRVKDGKQFICSGEAVKHSFTGQNQGVYYTDLIYGGRFTYDEMVEDAKKNYDYGDPTNALTYSQDWWKEYYKCTV